MAAPSLTRNATAINYGNTIIGTAPQFRNALAPASYTAGGFNLPSDSRNNLYGARFALPATLDISARKAVRFSMQINTLYLYSMTDTPAGISIIFYDTSGNWSRFFLGGGNTTENKGAPGRPYWLDNYAASDGYFRNFTDAYSDGAMDFFIYLDATPVETSGGGIDWSQIAGYEIHVNRNSVSHGASYILTTLITAIDTPVVKNGDVTTPVTATRIYDLFRQWASATAPYRDFRSCKPIAPLYGVGTKETLYVLGFDLTIGDGTTQTVYNESNFAMVFRASYGTGLDQYAAFHVGGTQRKLAFNRSATDSTTLSAFSITGANMVGGDFDFEIVGATAGTCTLTDGTIYAAGTVDIRYGTLAVTFEKCTEVIYSPDVDYAGCAIVNNTYAATKGFTINAAPGDYSAIDIRFADNTSGHDIEITPTSAGTFDFSGLSVKSGQSLKIHNNSALAITVKLAAGISPTPSGGQIIIDTPTVNQSVTIVNLPATARLYLYDNTAAEVLYNGIPSATDYTWTDANPAESSREIYCKITDYAETGGYSIAKAPFAGIIGICGTDANDADVGYRADLQDFTLINDYAALAVKTGAAIDSTHGGPITADFANIQIDVTTAIGPDGFGEFDCRDGALWWTYIIHTADGIAQYNPYAIQLAPDIRNIIVNGPLQIEAKAPTRIVGGIWTRADGGYLIADESQKLHWVPDGRVYQPEDADPGAIAQAVLSAAQTAPIHADTKRLNGATVRGTGIDSDKWRGGNV